MKARALCRFRFFPLSRSRFPFRFRALLSLWAIAFFLAPMVPPGLLPMGALPAAAQDGPPAARVVAMNVFKEQIAPTSRIVGVIDFERLAGLSTEISGLIVAQSMPEGKVVEAGDALLTLSADFTEKDIAIRKIEAEQVGIKIENARKNLERYRALFRQEATSEKSYEDLADSLRELIKHREAIRTDIERLQLQLEKSTLRAPFKGLILQRFKNTGEWVTPGTPVCSLAAIDSVYVKVAVSEDLVRFIAPGQEVALTLPALDKDLTGTVTGFVLVADPATKTFHVKIAIPYSPELILNMSAAVEVPVGPVREVAMIKRDALTRSQGKVFVYAVKEGKAAMLPINIVGYKGEFVGVDNPYIQPGMPVVVEGNDRLRPDQAVEIIETRTPDRPAEAGAGQAPANAAAADPAGGPAPGPEDNPAENPDNTPGATKEAR